MIEYVRSVSNNIQSQTVNLGGLESELRATAIKVVLLGSALSGDTLTITYAATLDVDDEAIFTATLWAHTGSPQVDEPQIVRLDAPYDISGRPIMAQGHKVVDESWRRTGMKFEATNDAITFFDFEITDQIYLQGGIAQIQPLGIMEGDFMEFSIVDKDDVYQPGLMGMLGLVPGVDVLELKKFVQTEYLPWWKPGGVDLIVKPSTVSLLMPGLYMRCAYHAINATNVEDRKIKVLLKYEYFNV